MNWPCRTQYRLFISRASGASFARNAEAGRCRLDRNGRLRSGERAERLKPSFAYLRSHLCRDICEGFKERPTLRGSTDDVSDDVTIPKVMAAVDQELAGIAISMSLDIEPLALALLRRRSMYLLQLG
jgi:hypothetical protein